VLRMQLGHQLGHRPFRKKLQILVSLVLKRNTILNYFNIAKEKVIF
jgi:hypothetical protein